MAVAYAAVLYPLSVWFKNSNLTLSTISPVTIFPAFGLIAFTLLWLHSMSGVFETQIRKHLDFDKFVHRTSIIILVSIILHPLLLIAYFDFNIKNLSAAIDKYIRLGIIGWILLITYDIGKALRKYKFFSKNWNNILIISTIGFLLTFFHSLYLGSDLQSGPLRIIWIFYGVTAILATIYTYGIKRLVV